MQFLYPAFLLALLALAIPLIIHLFYFRRFKKVYFTNVRFLKEVKEETSARRRLRNLLVMLMRMLAIAALVFAFAQLFIPKKDSEVKQGEKAVSVFIDNSFSMKAESQDVALLDKAKQRAREIVQAYTPEDRFQILTHDLEGRHQHLLSKEDALTLIDEVQESPAVQPLSRILSRQKQALTSGESEQHTAYIVSDFQRNICDFSNFKDTTLQTFLVPLQAVQERNISIDSCYFVAPAQVINQTNTLIIQLTNHSDQGAENIRLAMQHEGQEKPIGNLSIPAGETVFDTANITVLRSGWHEVILQITDYPIQFDDKYYLTFHVAEQINVLSINKQTSNKYVDAALKGISYFNLTNLGNQNLDYSKFPDYQLIIVNDLDVISSGLTSELQQYVQNGGNILVFPGDKANLDSYAGFLRSFRANTLGKFDKQKRAVSGINTEEFIFKDVFEGSRRNLKLPATLANYPISGFNRGAGEVLLRYRDGDAFMTKYQYEQGHLYLCAAPLNEDYSDLVRNAEVFVPMLYKMALSKAQNDKIAYIIGTDELLETENRSTGAESLYRLRGKPGEFIPERRNLGNKVLLNLNNMVKESGVYDLLLKDNEPMHKYAFNYNRRESSQDYFSSDDLKNEVSNNIQIIDGTNVTELTPLIGERSRGTQLWWWCVVFALIFLAIEGLLLRFWKT